MEINFKLENTISPLEVAMGLGIKHYFDPNDNKSVEDAIQKHLKDLCLNAYELTQSIKKK